MNQTSSSAPEELASDTSSPPPQKDTPVSWNVLDAFLVLIVFIVFSLSLDVILALLHVKLDINIVVFFLFGETLVATAVNLSLIFYLIRRRGGKINELGLSFRKMTSSLNLGMGVGFALLFVNLASVIILRFVVGQELPTQVVTEIVEKDRDLFRQVLMFFLAAAVAPVNEETLIRGFLYQSLKKKWGIAWGVVISAMIFTILHIQPFLFPTIFILGIILALLFEWRRSLLTNIIAHGTMNGIIFLLAAAAS